MADLYAIVESEYQRYEKGSKSLFTEDLLRELCLGLNSMCVGAESKFFNGHTNISDDRFIVFGVKGLMEVNMKLKNAIVARTDDRKVFCKLLDIRILWEHV